MMTDLISRTKFVAVLAIAVVLVVIGVLNLRDRLSTPPIPDDGIEWADTEKGVRARSVRPDSPLAFTIRKGDHLRAIYYKDSYELVQKAETVSLFLERKGVGASARYVIEHRDPALQSIFGIDKGLYDVDFVVTSMPERLGQGLYLAFVGVVYLAIGVFVLFGQRRAALTYHFFAWSLVSFISYFFSAPYIASPFDKAVSLIDNCAVALLAPLFLHFCISFRSAGQKPPRGLVTALYIPAILLIAAEVFFHYKPAYYPAGQLSNVRSILNISGLVQLLVFLAAATALLVWTFIRSRRLLLRQQLKWVIWGLGLSVPFAALSLVPHISDVDIPSAIQTASYIPLLLIPVSFGYSIVRYRMMDVDVIMRRSFVHVMATVAVGAIYMAVLLGVGDLVKFIWQTADLNSWKTRVVVVAGMLVVAMLFNPIRNKLQVWADRWFYGERYTLRMGLQDFGRTLAQTTALPHLLDSLVRRLSEMLSVRTVAIFIEDPFHPSGFKLAHRTGLADTAALPLNIRDLLRTRSIGRGFITAFDLQSDVGSSSNRLLPENSFSPEMDLDASGENEALAGLDYFVPCVVRDRMVAIIAVGRSTSGALLTSEDTELMRALSGYVAVAIENSLLYRSEREKAEELARLKEFSDNIVESVSVGIAVVDVRGVITTWNSALEEIFGITRDRAIGSRFEELMDADLIETIHTVTGQDAWIPSEARHIYKYSASTEDGRPLTLNMSLAPFEAIRGVVAGMLIVVENVTERAQLEQQLLQREKLSSIGLLAAGVAHEVNTPLAGISSYAQMLLQQVGEADPSRRLLEKIRVQTDRASGIVNNLLNFSRTGDTQFREVDINAVLDDTLQLLEPQLRNSAVRITRNYARDLPPAHGNASKFQQVFMNLILNARDAMPQGGNLTISTRGLDSSLVVDFRDTGVGIPPENIARIYDPFFTTKEVGQGTGLGLALSYGIIQEHGGRIFVESRLGEGTHFTIKIPTAYSRQIQAASD